MAYHSPYADPLSPPILARLESLWFHSQMISPSFQAKIVFFDRSIARTNWRAINETPLKRAGLLVRSIARRKIGRLTKRKTTRPRAPGQPPRARMAMDSAGRHTPFKRIFSLPQNLGTSVIIGMEGWSSEAIPGLHEHGGRAYRRVFKPAGRRQLKKGGLGGVVLKPVKQYIRIPKRPFMWPSLIEARTKLPSLWLNSLGGSSAA